jgi:hypothetical protein
LSIEDQNNLLKEVHGTCNCFPSFISQPAQSTLPLSEIKKEMLPFSNKNLLEKYKNMETSSVDMETTYSNSNDVDVDETIWEEVIDYATPLF